MKRSNRLILLIGFVLAAAAFVGVIMLSGGNQNPGGGPEASAPPTELDTVVALRDVPLGVKLTEGMVGIQKVKVENREPGALGDVSQAIGKVVRQEVTKGQQVTLAQFTDTGSADDIECPIGLSCMAVLVDQVSGVGTLIRSGDFVDVVAQVAPGFPLIDTETAVRIPDQDYDHVSIKVLLQGLQVISTLLPPVADTTQPGASPAPDPGGGGTALTGQQQLVILAVTQQQAEVLKFLQVNGSITLTLRSPKDFVDAAGNPIIPETVTTTGIVLRTTIEQYGVLPPDFIVVPAPTPQP